MNQLFKTVLSKFTYGEHVHPERDWFTLLTLSFMVLVVGVVWNTWLFNDVSSGGVLSGSATSTPPAFSKTSLQAVQKVFSDRAALEAQYVAGVKTFTDPSR